MAHPAVRADFGRASRTRPIYHVILVCFVTVVYFHIYLIELYTYNMQQPSGTGLDLDAAGLARARPLSLKPCPLSVYDFTNFIDKQNNEL